MNHIKTSIELQIKPSELLTLSEKFKKAAEEQIKQFKEKSFIGEICMPYSCENTEIGISFIWKPVFENDKVVNL